MDELKRPVNESNQLPLFEMEPDWKDVWWNMPEYDNDVIKPSSKIVVNFLTDQDREDFSKKIGIKLGPTSDSIWYPAQPKLKPGLYYYDGNIKGYENKYPICIPSKGRWDVQTTGKLLDRMGVNYLFFVEDIEYDLYCDHLGRDKVIKLPFNNLGQGSIPARNYIWEWAKNNGYSRHWVLDDNIRSFGRVHMTRRLKVRGGGYFRAMEDFVDRYENIVMAGPHEGGFVPIGWVDFPPYLLNTRVYSCILLDTSLPHRWRGRYNEDTDLSLRLLKDGYCTLVFRALIMNKSATVGSKNSKPMKGGNTDNVYNTGDHRKAFAESLKEQHPDCVEVVWKFNRWHHSVNYSKFIQQPKLKPGITPIKKLNNYGMKLVRSSKYDPDLIFDDCDDKENVNLDDTNGHYAL